MTAGQLVAALVALSAVAALLGPRRPAGRGRAHSMRYALYLHSPLWRMRRRLWIIAAGGRCQRCRRFRRPLTIHHRTYARLGHERRNDIEVLCWGCHNSRHQSWGEGDGFWKGDRGHRELKERIR